MQSFEKILARTYEENFRRGRNVMVFVSAIAFILGMAQSAQMGLTAQISKEQVRVLPVTRTPESDSIILTISVPKAGDIVEKDPMWMQFRIEGYALGADSSQFDRASELALTDMGQTVHVIIDDKPYFPINEPAINPFNEEGYYRDTNYRFRIPYSLNDGIHTIRVFPARSFGESLKGSGTFHAIVFQKGTSSKKFYGVDLSTPYLTYNEPSDNLPLQANLPILLDFLVANCELTSDGYKVRLSVDGNVVRMLNSLQPYYIYGLSKGQHTIRLELLDPQGTRVPGKSNDVQRTISVQ